MARIKATDEQLEKGRALEAGADLAASELPKRSRERVAFARILLLYEDYARDYPDRVEELLRRCSELTENYRLPRETRDLNSVEAARLIGISDERVSQLYQAGRLGGCLNGRPRFSEKECLAYRQSDRRPGRRPKNP